MGDVTRIDETETAQFAAVPASPEGFRPNEVSPIAAIELAEERSNSTPDVDPLGSKVRKGAIWSALSTLIFKFANITIMAIVVRELDQKDFGVFAVAITAFTIISSFAELGVSACLIRGDVDLAKVAPTVATIAMVSSGTLAAIMFVFAEPISRALGSSDADGPLRVLALAVLMVGFFAVPSAEVTRNFRQDQQFVASVIGFVPSNALLLVMAANGGGAMSFAWSRVVGQVCVGMALIYFAKEPYRFGFSPKQAKFVLAFGLPLAGANLLNFVLLNADYALVGRLLGEVKLATYMLAFNIASWSTSLLAAMINGTGLAAFSRVKDDPVRLQRVLGKATAAIALIALPVCSMTFVLAPDLVRTVYGDKWSATAPILTILSLYGAISLFCLLLANVLSGLGYTRALFVVQVVWLAALVPAMTVGVHIGGVEGVAWAHIVIVLLVAMPAYLAMLKRSSNVRLTPLIPAVMPAVIASVVSAVVAAVAIRFVEGDLPRLLVGGILGGLAYAALALPTMLPLMANLSKLPPSIMQPLERYGAFVNSMTASVQPHRYRTAGRHRV
ncbi:polysaccharide transporter, PST family [Frankineae bacterium MT45]|nr:polysaccharide transporter, PST family [Frankineae bacterium MT45]